MPDVQINHERLGELGLSQIVLGGALQYARVDASVGKTLQEDDFEPKRVEVTGFNGTIDHRNILTILS